MASQSTCNFHFIYSEFLAYFHVFKAITIFYVNCLFISFAHFSIWWLTPLLIIIQSYIHWGTCLRMLGCKCLGILAFLSWLALFMMASSFPLLWQNFLVKAATGPLCHSYEGILCPSITFVGLYCTFICNLQWFWISVVNVLWQKKKKRHFLPQMVAWLPQYTLLNGLLFPLTS